MLRIDTKNTLQESFAQMTNVLGRIPEGVPIMLTAINDQSAIGMLRAVKQAGRQADVVVVGNGADETKALVDEPDLVAATGYFPETYGNYLIPIALSALAGKELPPAVLVNHVMINKANVCQYYPDFKCTDKAGLRVRFPAGGVLGLLDRAAQGRLPQGLRGPGSGQLSTARTNRRGDAWLQRLRIPPYRDGRARYGRRLESWI